MSLSFKLSVYKMTTTNKFTHLFTFKWSFMFFSSCSFNTPVCHVFCCCIRTLCEHLPNSPFEWHTILANVNSHRNQMECRIFFHSFTSYNSTEQRNSKIVKRSCMYSVWYVQFCLGLIPISL